MNHIKYFLLLVILYVQFAFCSEVTMVLFYTSNSQSYFNAGLQVSDISTYLNVDNLGDLNKIFSNTSTGITIKILGVEPTSLPDNVTLNEQTQNLYCINNTSQSVNNEVLRIWREREMLGADIVGVIS